MNKLILLQRLHSEASVAGNAPTTTINQTGIIAKLVNWIDFAYEDVQNLHPTWNFLREDFSFSTTSGTQEYTATDASISDLASWKTDDIRIYKFISDESQLYYVNWDLYRTTYLIGSTRTTSSRPSIISVKPNMSLILWPIPDDTYTVNGEYFKQPDIMSLDSDVPIIPSQFHMILVWRALMFYGAKMGAADIYTHGYNEYKRMLRRLEMNQLEHFTWGPSLV